MGLEMAQFCAVFAWAPGPLRLTKLAELVSKPDLSLFARTSLKKVRAKITALFHAIELFVRSYRSRLFLAVQDLKN